MTEYFNLKLRAVEIGGAEGLQPHQYFRMTVQRLYKRGEGGKGGICPHWNFQNQGISPDLPILKVESMTFQGFYSNLPLLDSNPYTGTA